jgi:hypothetical protein
MKSSLGSQPHTIRVTQGGKVEHEWTDKIDIRYFYEGQRLVQRKIEKDGTTFIEELGYTQDGLVSCIQRDKKE